MNSNGGRAAGSGKREFYTVFALLVMVFMTAGALFVVPAWAQQEQRQVSEERRAQIEGLSDAETQEQFVQAAQTSNAAGDLSGEPAEAEGDNEDVDRIVIEGAENCDVDEDATITFQEDGDGNEIGVVENGEGAEIDPQNNRIVIRSEQEGGNINFVGDTDLDPGDLTVLSSSGIDCGDPDNNDGFDDELLLLLLLELLEDNDDGDNDDGDNDDGDNDDGGDDGDDGNGDDQYDDENGEDLDGDGDVDQEDELFEAESELNGEGTEGTNGDEFGTEDFDEGDGGVSATADEGGAEASTPGASASAGGDPDEQAPVSEPQGDVEDEIVTSGPLPNTGGVPVATGTVLAMVLFGGGLLVVRLVMIWRERRA